MEFKQGKSPLFYSVSIFIFLFITASALLLYLSNINKTSPYLDNQHLSSAGIGIWVQDAKKISEDVKNENAGTSFKTNKNNEVWLMRMSAGIIRRMLSGIGSSPPRCIAKCGRCSPCKPVHVAVPPGRTPANNEYYPEAWRCKCGNKLYIP